MELNAIFVLRGSVPGWCFLELHVCVASGLLNSTCQIRGHLRQHTAQDWGLIPPPPTSLVVQWLRLGTSTAGGTGSIPGRGTKIPHASQCSQKKEKDILIPPPPTKGPHPSSASSKRWVLHPLPRSSHPGSDHLPPSSQLPACPSHCHFPRECLQ